MELNGLVEIFRFYTVWSGVMEEKNTNLAGVSDENNNFIKDIVTEDMKPGGRCYGE